MSGIKLLQKTLNQNPQWTAFSAAVAERGSIFLTGGAVIDVVFKNSKPKDYDFEIFNITEKELVSIFRRLNISFKNVGNEFGVWKISLGRLECDISLPRKEKKTGQGYKGFSIEIDPFLSLENAARRRDLTINAIYLNVITGEVFDPFGGINDFKAGRMRAVDEQSFQEDPLRVMRIMQIVARKGKDVDEKTIELARNMIHTFPFLTSERVEEEWVKLLTKASRPWLGIKFLLQSGWLKWYKEINPSPDLKKRLHFLGRSSLKGFFPFGLACLLMNSQKPFEWLSKTIRDKKVKTWTLFFINTVTKFKEQKISPVELATLLKDNFEVIQYVEKLIQIEIDIEENQNEFLKTNWIEFKKLQKRFNDERPRPLISGQDLIENGFEPGPAFKKLLNRAWELEIKEKWSKERIIQQLKQNRGA